MLSLPFPLPRHDTEVAAAVSRSPSWFEVSFSRKRERERGIKLVVIKLTLALTRYTNELLLQRTTRYNREINRPLECCVLISRLACLALPPLLLPLHATRRSREKLPLPCSRNVTASWCCASRAPNEGSPRARVAISRFFSPPAFVTCVAGAR